MISLSVRTTLAAGSLLLLGACVDTTGLSDTIHDEAHPASNPNAAVTVTEYADLECPACRAAHPQIVQPLLEQYGDRIRFEFRHFPLASIHRYAVEAAEAVECAHDQGTMWEMIDIIYERQDQLNSEALGTWAEELGMDADLYRRCMASHIKRDAILASYEQGRELGVTGTPSFFVNGEKVNSTLEDITAAIEQKIGTMQQQL